MITINFEFQLWLLVPIFWTVLGLAIVFTVLPERRLSPLPADVTPFQYYRGLASFYMFCWFCTAGSAIAARLLP